MQRQNSGWTFSPSSAHDANGSTLSDSSGKQYTWDFENRLMQVVNPGVGTTTFRYDPFGRRIQKFGPLGTTNYVYDFAFSRLLKSNGWNVIEELDNGGNLLSRDLQGQVMDQTFAASRSGVTTYLEQDGIGSVTSLSNSSATLANTYTYDSFGNLNAYTGTVTNPFRYAGREFDSETSIYEYRARYFDPAIGRFTSEDPIGFDAGINFYQYVMNRPLSMVDPLGLSVLAYDNGWLYVYDVNVNLLGVCPAQNNTMPNSRGAWPAGSYPYLYHNNHPPDPNGPYGSYGIFIFDRRPCNGCGIHSGRANRGGPSARTLGCIRTTDACMQWLTQVNAADPITHLVVW